MNKFDKAFSHDILCERHACFTYRLQSGDDFDCYIREEATKVATLTTYISYVIKQHCFVHCNSTFEALTCPISLSHPCYA